MKRMRQMYMFAQYVDEVNTEAENNRDSKGLMAYPSRDDIIKEYAQTKKKSVSEITHLQSSCIENGYLWKDYFHIYVHDGKGRHFLDKLWFIPTGYIEETLRQYQYSLTVILSTAFLALIALLWNIGKAIIHHHHP